MPDRVVFIDETAVKTNLTRLRGRAKRGERLTMDTPFGSWGTQTLIAGLTHDALIAPWVIKGAMDGPAFAAYIRDVRVPEVTPGTVIRRGIDPPDRFLILLIPRQLGYPPKQGSRTGLTRPRLLVPLPAALLA